MRDDADLATACNLRPRFVMDLGQFNGEDRIRCDVDDHWIRICV